MFLNFVQLSFHLISLIFHYSAVLPHLFADKVMQFSLCLVSK